MNDWILIGHRYINLANVAEVQFDSHARTARLLYAGGATDTLHDDEAGDLHDVLSRLAAVPDEPHRKVYIPS